MTTRAQQKARTRQRLLEVALERCTRDGITATRTVDIARAAGVSHGTVFVHFPTRDDLVAEVVGVVGARVIRRIHDLVEAAAGVFEVLQAHLDGLAEFEEFYARLVTEGAVLPPFARSMLFGIQSAISWHLAQASEREAAAGLIRPVPPHLLFNTWIGLLNHYLTHRDLFAPGESVLARHGPDLLDHLMGLLRP